MSPIRHIFLDDGGVINDNSLRAPQWERLVGEYFVPRLGGTTEGWADANRISIDETFRRFIQRLDAWQEGVSSYVEVVRSYDIDWLSLMFSHVGIQVQDDDKCARLARDAIEWIHPQVKAEFPGASNAVLELGSNIRCTWGRAGHPSSCVCSWSQWA
jgi:hypothetical protein